LKTIHKGISCDSSIAESRDGRKVFAIDLGCLVDDKSDFFIMIKIIPRHSLYFTIDFNSIFLGLRHVYFKMAKVVLGNVSRPQVGYNLICNLVFGLNLAAKPKSVITR